MASPMIKRYLPGIILVLALLGFLRLFRTTPDLPEQQTDNRVVIDAEPVEFGNYAPTTKIYGTFLASKEAELSAKQATNVLSIEL